MVWLLLFCMLIVLMFFFISMPFVLIYRGVRTWNRTYHQQGFWSGFLGLCLAFPVCYFVVMYFVWCAPGKSGILDSGFLPKGNEYCIFQVYQDFFDPYEIVFCARDVHGIWRLNCLAEGINGRRIGVDFLGSTAKIRLRKDYAVDINLDAYSEEPSTLGCLPSFPVEYSKEDVFRAYARKGIGVSHEDKK